jgi:ribosomal protein S18 acetylase RimI-like enzyme
MEIIYRDEGSLQMDIEIGTYTPALGRAIEDLQRKYIAANPRGTKLVSKELYHQHPALEQGRNVFCALEQGEVLVGYGALIPTPAEPSSSSETPNTIWVHIRVDPEREDFREIRQAIYERLLDKSLTYSRAWKDRRTRIAISYPESLGEEIGFFREKGFRRFDALLQMIRDLSVPSPDLELPEGVIVRRWGMETEQDRMQYIAAEAAVFPHSPRTVEELAFYMGSWKGGTPITAFDEQGNIVGSLMAYWYGKRNGVTEDIFVTPEWRRMGIASHLITEGIRYLIENGVEVARLEVKETNTPAVRLYESLGYGVVNREEQLGMDI